MTKSPASQGSPEQRGCQWRDTLYVGGAGHGILGPARHPETSLPFGRPMLPPAAGLPQQELHLPLDSGPMYAKGTLLRTSCGELR